VQCFDALTRFANRVSITAESPGSRGERISSGAANGGNTCKAVEGSCDNRNWPDLGQDENCPK
jgi:hypothetical protein